MSYAFVLFVLFALVVAIGYTFGWRERDPADPEVISRDTRVSPPDHHAEPDSEPRS